MPDGTVSYKTDQGVFDIPADKADAFLKKYPKAEKVNSFTVAKDTFDIPVDKVDAFKQKYPDAQPLDLKKKESTVPNAGENTEGQQGNGSQTSYDGSPWGLIAGNLNPHKSSNVVRNVPDDKSAFDEASKAAERHKKVLEYEAQYHDAIAEGKVPLATPAQMFTPKERQAMLKDGTYQRMTQAFISNPNYLEAKNRETYYGILQHNAGLDDKEMKAVRAQGEEAAYQQAAYNVARDAFAQKARFGKTPDAQDMATVGDYQLNNGDIAKAVHTYGALIKVHPESPKGYVGLAAATYANHKDVNGALKFLEEGNKKTPNDPSILTASANFKWLKGSYDEAQKDIQAAVANAKPGSIELANALQFRAQMRTTNVINNPQGAREDREKALQTYQTYNARINYYYRGGKGIPIEEQKKMLLMTKDKDGNDVFQDKEKEKEVTVDLTQEEKAAEDKKAALEKKYTDISNEPKEGFWDTGFPWSKNYYTQEERKAMVIHQLMTPAIEARQEQEEADFIAKTQGMGVWDAYWANPHQFVVDYLDKASDAVINGVKGYAHGITSDFNVAGQLIQGKITAKEALKQNYKDGIEELKGIAGVAGGLVSFTPIGGAVNLGFQETITKLPWTKDFLQAGSWMANKGWISEDEGDLIDNAEMVGLMLAFHKGYKATFGGPALPGLDFNNLGTISDEGHYSYEREYQKAWQEQQEREKQQQQEREQYQQQQRQEQQKQNGGQGSGQRQQYKYKSGLSEDELSELNTKYKTILKGAHPDLLDPSQEAAATEFMKKANAARDANDLKTIRDLHDQITKNPFTKRTYTPPPRTDENPINSEPLKNMTEEEARYQEQHSAMMFKIFGGMKLTDADLLGIQNMMGGPEGVQKFMGELKNPDFFTKARKNNPGLLDDIHRQLNDFIEQQKAKYQPKDESAATYKAQGVEAPSEKSQQPVDESKQLTLKGEEYTKKGNKWLDGKGEEVVNAKKLSDLKKQEKAKTAEKPVEKPIEKVEKQTKKVTPKIVITPTPENPNIPFTIKVETPKGEQSFEEKHGIKLADVDKIVDESVKAGNKNVSRAQIVSDAIRAVKGENGGFQNYREDAKLVADYNKAKLEQELPKKLPNKKDLWDIEDATGEINVQPIPLTPLKAKTVEESLKNVVGDEDTKPILQYVYHDVQNKVKVATDAHSLVIIPDKTIKENKLVSPTGVDNTNLLKEGKFPNWQAVMPNHPAVLNVGDIQPIMDDLNGLERANKFVTGKKGYGIAAQIKHGDNEAYYNPTILKNTLQALQANGVKNFQFEVANRPDKALVVRDADNPENGAIGLAMPVFHDAENGVHKNILTTESTVNPRFRDQEIDRLQKKIKRVSEQPSYAETKEQESLEKSKQQLRELRMNKKISNPKDIEYMEGSVKMHTDDLKKAQDERQDEIAELKKELNFLQNGGEGGKPTSGKEGNMEKPTTATTGGKSRRGQKSGGEPTEYNALNAVKNQYNGTDTPLNETGELATEKYPMDDNDIRTQNIATIPSTVLSDIHAKLKGNGYSLDEQLEGANGLRFLNEMVKAGMLSEADAAPWRGRKSLNQAGEEKVKNIITHLLTDGLNGISKEPFLAALNSLPPKIAETIKGHAIKMLSMGINSPLDVVQEAILALEIVKSTGEFPKEMDDHTDAMTTVIASNAIHEFLNNYQVNLEDGLNKVDALNKTLSTDVPSTPTDEALKKVTHEKGKDTKSANPGGTDEAHQGSEQGAPPQASAGSPPRPPEPPNINDFTEPLPVDDGKGTDDINVVQNAVNPLEIFNALINIKDQMTRPWLNAPRHVIEVAKTGETNGVRATNAERNKLNEEMMNDANRISPEQETELWKFINEQHVKDGSDLALKKHFGVNSTKASHAPAPDHWTPQMKLWYKTINDLQDKAKKWFALAVKLETDKILPAADKKIQDTPNYLPEQEKTQSKIQKRISELIKIAQEDLLTKGKGFDKRTARTINKLNKKIRAWGLEEKKSLSKEGLYDKDINDMLTMPDTYRAVAPDGSHYVVRFNDNGTIDKWENQVPERIGTFKGQQNPKGRIWVAKTPEAGKADHFIFDDDKKDIEHGTWTSGKNKGQPKFYSRRQIVNMAQKETDFTKRAELLKKAKLPIDFFDKFESKKNPNPTLPDIVHKYGKFTDVHGVEHIVTPETTENKEIHTGREYEKRPMVAAIQLENRAYTLYKHTKFFHDIMNDKSIRDIVFTPDKSQAAVIDAWKRENKLPKNPTGAESDAYNKAKQDAYTKSGIPSDFDEEWTSANKESKKIDADGKKVGAHSNLPEMYRDTYFKNDDFRMLNGDMNRMPQDPKRMMQGVMNIVYITKLGLGFVHDWNIAENFILQGIAPKYLKTAHDAFINNTPYYKFLAENGLPSVGDAKKGMTDVFKSWTDYYAKQNTELTGLIDELHKSGLSKYADEIKKAIGTFPEKAGRFQKGMIWNMQNATYVNEVMGKTEEFGYQFPKDMKDIDYNDPKFIKASLRAINDLMRTSNTYFIGDKAYGLNNGLGQVLAVSSRSQLLTAFQAFHHGNVRVLGNMVGDLAQGVKYVTPGLKDAPIPGFEEGDKFVKNEPGKMSDHDKERIRRTTHAFMYFDRAFIMAGAIAYINHKLNKHDEHWFLDLATGGEEKLMELVVDWANAEKNGTATDKSNATHKLINSAFSVSPLTSDLMDVYNNRQSFNGKEIYHKEDGLIDSWGKLFAYMGAGGNMYQAIKYMKEGDIKGIGMGLATIFTPVKFKQLSPEQQQTTENIWSFKNTYEQELKKAREALDNASTTDKTYFGLYSGYMDLIQKSAGFTDEYMILHLNKWKNDILVNKMQSPLDYKNEQSAIKTLNDNLKDRQEYQSKLQAKKDAGTINQFEQQKLDAIPDQIKKLQDGLETIKNNPTAVSLKFIDEKIKLAEDCKEQREKMIADLNKQEPLAVKRGNDDSLKLRYKVMDIMDTILNENKEMLEGMNPK